MDDDSDIQYKNEKEKDNLIQKIINNIRSGKNISIKCKIIKEEEHKNERENNLIFMTINVLNKDYIQFIRKNNSTNLENKYIIFEIKDIKLMLINNKHYFYLEYYRIIENEIYELKETYIFNAFQEINKDTILSTIKLRAKEIFANLIDTKFIFQDLYGNDVNIIYNEDYEFENGRIYCFNGYIYNISKSQFEPTMISSIQDYSEDKNEINSFQDILNFEKNKLVSFKCKIKSFSIRDKYVTVSDLDLDSDFDEKEYKVKINNNLLKKISKNGINYFFNFLKINNNQF